MPIDPRKNFTLQKKCPIGSRNPICLALKNKEDAKEKKRKALELDEEGKPLKPKPPKPKPLKPDEPEKISPLPTPSKPDKPKDDEKKPKPIPSLFTPDIPSQEIQTKREETKPPLIPPPRRMGRYTDMMVSIIFKKLLITNILLEKKRLRHYSMKKIQIILQLKMI